MQNLNLTVGTIIEDSKFHIKYRIISINKEFTILIVMGITSIQFKIEDTDELYNKLFDSEFSIVAEESFIVNYGNLNDKAKETHDKNIAFIKDINNEFNFDFIAMFDNESKSIINKLIDKHAISRQTFWRYVRKYLQGGLNEYALLDKKYIPTNKLNNTYTKKTGRPAKFGAQGIIITPEVKKQFDDMITFYKNHREASFKSVYNRLINKYYSFTNNNGGRDYLPLCEQPTYNQFYYYAHKILDPENMGIIKSSKQEFRNNRRLLMSDSLKRVNGPGHTVEMDEQELDISIVSDSNHNVCIGRPVLYAMIDVYTKAILAISVSLENNSIQGFTNCLINLAENKSDFCNRYGIELTNPEVWPSNIYPMNFRFDRGSEYVSKQTKRILNDMNIKMHLVPGGTGSLKGVVEQLFHQLGRKTADIYENNGYISNRHDSKHHEESCLTLNEVTKIIITLVLSHNLQSMSKYPMTKDMISNNIVPTPLNIWKYGCEKYGNPRPITNIEQFKYDLLLDIDKAKLSRQGIILDGLYYHNPLDSKLKKEMTSLQNKKRKFVCRMDVRDVSKLYYIRDNQLLVATLNPDKTGNCDYIGMTRVEYLNIYEKKKKLIASAKYVDQMIASDSQMIVERIVSDASKRKVGKSNTSNMNENRKQARQKYSNENTVDTRLNKQQNVLDTNVKIEEKHEEIKPLKEFSFDDYLDC